MDDDERRKRLGAYGFSEETPEDTQKQPTDVPQAPADEPETIIEGDSPAGLSGVVRTGSTLDRVVHSWGFLVGMIVLLGAFLAGLLVEWGVVPSGDAESLAILIAAFFLAPSAVTLWWAVGVLAPPAPFRTGLLLGLLQASLFTTLAFLVEAGPYTVTARVDPVNVLGLWLLALVVASLGTGISGWLVRRALMERAAPGQAEPRARPLPSLVIAVLLICTPLMSLADDSTEWLAVGLFGAVMTGSMIAWGLAAQRRRPERRGLIIAVGLLAGLVAGLAMLQAIWAEGRWSHRRWLTDTIAITAGAALVFAAAYAAYAPGGQLASRTYVIAPAVGADPSSTEIDLTRDILATRLEAIGADPGMHVHDDGRITARVAEALDQEVVVRSLGLTGILEFTPVPEQYEWDTLQDEPLPEGMVDIEPIFGGSEVTAARLGQDQTTAEIVVNLEFSEAGARLFDEHANEHFGERFAIVFDDIIVSAPSINARRFGGQAQISGGFTPQEAQAMVAVLSAGRSLPYEVTVEAE